jgi:transglutaminase-like putative cysteine protease
MADLVRRRRDHRTIRELAVQIATSCPPLDDVCRMQRVRGWVAAAVHYERDPRGGDLLQDPVALVEKVQAQGHAAGDCDDASMLTAVLLESLGIPTRFCAISTRPDGRLHHVSAEARDKAGTWYWLDSFSQREVQPPTTRTLKVNV